MQCWIQSCNLWKRNLRKRNLRKRNLQKRNLLPRNCSLRSIRWLQEFQPLNRQKTQSKWQRARPSLRKQDRLTKRRKRRHLRLLSLLQITRQKKLQPLMFRSRMLLVKTQTPQEMSSPLPKLLSVVSIFVSMIGIYYKHEEIKRVFSKKPPQTPLPSPEMQRPLPQPCACLVDWTFLHSYTTPWWKLTFYKFLSAPLVFLGLV